MAIQVLFFIFIFGYILWRAQKVDKTQLRQKFSELQNAASEGQKKVASDGHVIPAKDDISCARYGHQHKKIKDPAFPEAQFIVHNEPPTGYINLNGKMLKRSEADEYMRKYGG
ncbi:MAG: hypothetical protein K6B72_07900 [Lachnospiraceae bacterium]|nr:hypothetical protein [Lachnospiraceae bacterium]